jgi:3-deoxy-7-phosphoheptulonate synthase
VLFKLIIILKPESKEADRKELKKFLEDMDISYIETELNDLPIIHILENQHLLDTRIAEDFSAVSRAVRLSSPSPLAVKNKLHHKKKTITVKGHIIGDSALTVIAGPCSIESYEQLHDLALLLKRAGANILRAGAFKPRTSPYSFQGLGKTGLDDLKRVANETGMPVVTEIMDTKDLDIVSSATDIFQVGMRNMRNYPLLKELGKTAKPVLLKRAMDASVEEWLLSAEYILKEGNENVILCERGVLNASSSNGRTIMDLNGMLDAMERSSLPVIVDPSHAAAERGKVAPLAKAAVAAGADGVMIEVHPNPRRALSDGFQALFPEQFEALIADLRKIRELIQSQEKQ